MEDNEFYSDLDRRLKIIENPETKDKILEKLPLMDFLLAVAGYAILSIALLWWGFCV